MWEEGFLHPNKCPLACYVRHCKLDIPNVHLWFHVIFFLWLCFSLSLTFCWVVFTQEYVLLRYTRKRALKGSTVVHPRQPSLIPVPCLHGWSPTPLKLNGYFSKITDEIATQIQHSSGNLWFAKMITKTHLPLGTLPTNTGKLQMLFLSVGLDNKRCTGVIEPDQ